MSRLGDSHPRNRPRGAAFFVLIAAALGACTGGDPVVSGPSATGSPTATATTSPTGSPPGSPAASPTSTGSPTGAPVFEFTQGQMSLEISGEVSFAGSHLLDRVFSEPPSAGEADGTYGWFSADGNRVVLNVPKVGAWSVSGTLDGAQISFDECTVKRQRNDPSGLVGSFTCGRVTRSGTVAPAGTASATFSQEP